MALLVDVYNGLVKQGTGPIATATGWTQTTRLDRVGSFSFTCSASDPQAAYLVNRYTVYAYENGVLVGAGVIEKIQQSIGGDGVPVIQVSGPDLAIELTWARTGEVSLSTTNWQTAVNVSQVEINPEGSGRGAYTHAACVDGDASTGTWGRLDLYEAASSTGDGSWHKWFYVGGASTWNQMYVYCQLDSSGPSTGYGGGLLSAGTFQYYDGYGWCTAAVATDDTDNGVNSFVQSGAIAWTASTGGVMKQTTELGTAGYFLRGHLPTNADGLLWFEVKTWGPAPTANALHCLDAVLPQTGNGYVGSWSFAAGSTATTSTGVYANLYEENCFEALTLIAEQTGEHFICQSSDRTIKWLGKVSST